MSETTIAAVDGCRGGWAISTGVIEADRKSSEGAKRIAAGSIEFAVATNFAEVLQLAQAWDLVLVDMPIGLSEGKKTADATPEAATTSDWPRCCDLLVKEALKGKRSSLFLAPPRGTLDAADPTEFQRRHRQLTGVGASLPVWGIVPKIAELDCLLTPSIQRRVHEYHPELTWCRLGGPSLPKKKSREGADVRWQILQEWMDRSDLDSAQNWRATRRSTVGEDDLLDAMVGLVTGMTFGQYRYPVDHQYDSRGLSMEIYY